MISNKLVKFLKPSLLHGTRKTRCWRMIMRMLFDHNFHSSIPGARFDMSTWKYKNKHQHFSMGCQRAQQNHGTLLGFCNAFGGDEAPYPLDVYYFMLDLYFIRMSIIPRSRNFVHITELSSLLLEDPFLTPEDLTKIDSRLSLNWYIYSSHCTVYWLKKSPCAFIRITILITKVKSTIIKVIIISPIFISNHVIQWNNILFLSQIIFLH